MTVDHQVIDLDEHGDGFTEPDEGACSRSPARRATSLHVIGAFVLGAALGLCIAEVQDSRQAQTKPSTGQEQPASLPVAVGAVAGPVKGGSGVSGGSAQFEAQVTVVNAGPQPIKVRIAEAEQLPGLAIRTTDQARELPPSETSAIDVEVAVDCSSFWAHVTVRLSVETADQRTDQVIFPMALMDSVWEDHAERLCTQTGRAS